MRIKSERGGGERGIERGDSDRDNGGRYMNKGLAHSIYVRDRP